VVWPRVPRVNQDERGGDLRRVPIIAICWQSTFRFGRWLFSSSAGSHALFPDQGLTA